MGLAMILYSRETKKFLHKDHGKDLDLTCQSCHVNILKSTKVADVNLPDKKSCASECHEAAMIEKVSFTLFSSPYTFMFNHSTHASSDNDCQSCHKGLKKETYTSGSAMPKMADCFVCHDNETASRACSSCHTGSVVPKDHMVGCNKLHKIKANNNIRECMNCHESRSFCAKCHTGSLSFFFHGSNYEIMHKYDARFGTTKCRSCHSDSQCRNCHLAKGRHPENSFFGKQHPSGWNSLASPNHHKQKARTSLATCTVCHTRNDCIRCHFIKMR